MNLLDENISESQRRLLQGWRIRVRQIGVDLGRSGMNDEEIISLLHRLPRATFFTRDLGFYRRELCHANYSIVCLAVGPYEAASFIRRFLHHAALNTRAKRLGRVLLVTHGGIRLWQLNAAKEEALTWQDKTNSR
jgi:hypothetical protein